MQRRRGDSIGWSVLVGLALAGCCDNAGRGITGDGGGGAGEDLAASQPVEDMGVAGAPGSGGAGGALDLSGGFVPPTAATVLVGPGGTNSFAPATVVVAPGGTVTWQWVSGLHTVTSGSPGAPDGMFCSAPGSPSVSRCSGAGYAQSGGSFAFTFPSVGAFAYYCAIHGALMTGTVVVASASASPDLASGAFDLAAAPPPDLASAPPVDLVAAPLDLASLVSDLAGVPPPDLAGVPPPDLASPPAPHTVDVAIGAGDTLSFAPASVQIAAGDSVRWTWMSSSIPHTVASGTAPSADGTFCSAPGAPSIVTCSGIGYATTAPNVYTHAFASAGTFPYFCTVHGALMTGVVTVR